MAQPPQATTTHATASKKPLRYKADFHSSYVFRPKARHLVDRYLVPMALHGRIPEDEIQDGVADGVDVYAARPEALLPHCDRGNREWHSEACGYFFATRPPAAAAGSGDGDDTRDVAGGGCWCRYGGEKEYASDDGEAYAFRTRLAFYGARDGGKLTRWRVKEYRLNEAAARFRGVAFHPGARDLVVWKFYDAGEIYEEEPTVEYYSSDDGGGGEDGAEVVTVRDAIAGPATTAA